MGGAKRQNRASSTMRNPPSQGALLLSASAPPPARVTLPSDLPGSLKYLDDAQLRRLLEAVTVEINRRNQGDAKKKGATPPVAGTSAKDQSVPVPDQTTRAIDEIPEGKANRVIAADRLIDAELFGQDLLERRPVALTVIHAAGHQHHTARRVETDFSVLVVAAAARCDGVAIPTPRSRP